MALGAEQIPKFQLGDCKFGRKVRVSSMEKYSME